MNFKMHTNIQPRRSQTASLHHYFPTAGNKRCRIFPAARKFRETAAVSQFEWRARARAFE
jgi:hypothetical protein